MSKPPMGKFVKIVSMPFVALLFGNELTLLGVRLFPVRLLHAFQVNL